MSVASSSKISSCSSFIVFFSLLKFPINSFYNSGNVHSIFNSVDTTVSFFFCVKKQFFKTGYIPTIYTSIINYDFKLHFIFLSWAGLSQPIQNFFQHIKNVCVCGVDCFAKRPSVPHSRIIIENQCCSIFWKFLLDYLMFRCSILNSVEMVKRKIMVVQPFFFRFSHRFIIVGSGNLAQPSYNGNFNPDNATLRKQIGKFCHVGQRFCDFIRGRVGCSQHFQPVLNAIQVSDSSIHVEHDFFNHFFSFLFVFVF